MKNRGFLIGALTSAVATAVAVAVISGVGGLLDYAAGLALGALTMSGLASMISGLGSSRRRGWQVLVVGLHLLKYPLILGILYVLLTELHRNALLVMGGYTLALLVFLAHLGTKSAGAKSGTEV